MAFSGLKEKLEEMKSNFSHSVNGIKAKFSKKDNSDDEFDEEYEEDTEENDVTSEHHIDDLDEEYDEESEDFDEEDEEDEETAKKKKRSRLIQVAIATLVVVIIADEFIGKKDGSNETSGSTDPLADLPDPPKKKKTVVKTAEPVNKPIQEEPKIAQPEIEVKPTPVEEIVEEQEAVEEEKVVAEVKDLESMDQASVEPEIIDSDNLLEDDDAKNIVQDNSQTNFEESMKDNFGTSESMDKETSGAPETGDMDQLEELDMDQGTNQKEAITQNQIEREEVIKDYQNNPDTPNYKKILSQVNINEIEEGEILPPQYQRSGRGLVYNCVDKHWACVDRVNYFRCAKVQKFSSSKGRSPSCVSREIYATPDHCARGQLKKIHTYKLPTECK